jgi:hypothetical protein
MFRKVSGFAVWLILGAVLALAPLSCSSEDGTTDSGTDGQSRTDAMTKS